jgi:hypothetical protein
LAQERIKLQALGIEALGFVKGVGGREGGRERERERGGTEKASDFYHLPKRTLLQIVNKLKGSRSKKNVRQCTVYSAKRWLLLVRCMKIVLKTAREKRKRNKIC